MDLPEFDVTIPLVRRNKYGADETHDVTMRIPAADKNTAEDAASTIAWQIVTHMGQNIGDNNRYGWKLASDGAAVEPAKGER